MELAAADTAYEKDRQIKILKTALLNSNDIMASSDDANMALQSLDNVEAIDLADKIEQEWRTEDK